MPQPPILKAMDEMMAKLVDAVRLQRESEKAVREYTDAIRALAVVCEDEETKANLLATLEDVTGKPGFMDAIRSVLRTHTKEPLTATEIRSWIVLGKRLDLSGYSNPMASIHTTLRRMKEKDEVEETTNAKGEKAYKLLLSTTDPAHSIHTPSDLVKITKGTRFDTRYKGRFNK